MDCINKAGTKKPDEKEQANWSEQVAEHVEIFFNFLVKILKKTHPIEGEPLNDHFADFFDSKTTGLEMVMLAGVCIPNYVTYISL